MDAPLHQGYSLVARLENRARARSQHSDDAAIRAEAIELAEALGVPRLAAAVRRATQLGHAEQAGRVDQTNSDSGTVDPSG